MKLLLLPSALLLSLVACTPKPPIYVVTTASADSLRPLRDAAFRIKPVAKIDLHDFKRAFVKKYGSEAAFIEGFQKDLAQALSEGVATGVGSAYVLELPRLDVDSVSLGYWTSVGGGPNMPPQQVYHSTEYCVITLDYRVKDASGRELLGGTVREKTAKGEFLHPNQSKLANAVQGVRAHLVDYLRGRLAPENIGAPEAPKAAPAPASAAK